MDATISAATAGIGGTISALHVLIPTTVIKLATHALANQVIMMMEGLSAPRAIINVGHA